MNSLNSGPRNVVSLN